jgi:hypothetical protein
VCEHCNEFSALDLDAGDAADPGNMLEHTVGDMFNTEE